MNIGSQPYAESVMGQLGLFGFDDWDLSRTGSSSQGSQTDQWIYHGVIIDKNHDAPIWRIGSKSADGTLAGLFTDMYNTNSTGMDVLGSPYLSSTLRCRSICLRYRRTATHMWALW